MKSAMRFASKDNESRLPVFAHCLRKIVSVAAIAQLGERQTEDLKVPGSIPGLGIVLACAGPDRHKKRD